MSRILCHLRNEAFRPKPQVESILNHVTICDLPRITTIVHSRTKYWHNRHRDDRYRRERAWKVWPVQLPDFDHWRNTKDDNASPEEIRSRLKEKGVAPPSSWNERELYQPCTMAVIEPYEPHHTDGKKSSLLNKLKNPLIGGKDLVKNRRSLGTIRSYEGEEFDLKDFAIKAKNVYIKAHELLAAEDNENIFDYVTEHCWPVMTAGLNKHTIIWKYLDDLEPPSVVQVRNGELMAKTNLYAQITVRFHSKQIMAIFDRHGRLIFGSPTNVKEVLEYIVFEKYLVNEYGEWRMHERIRVNNGESPPEALQTRVQLATP